jgi:hypothetical protein
MKAYWGSGRISPRIPDLGTRWRRVFSFMPRPLYAQGKSPCYPLDRRLGGPQSRSRRGGEEKNSQPLQGLELPVIQPVGQRYTTELSRIFVKCLTYSLTPWCKILFETLIVTQLVKNYLAFLWNPKVHHRVHKSPPLDPILSQLNPVGPIDPYLPMVHFNIILPPTPRSSSGLVPSGLPSKTL